MGELSSYTINYINFINNYEKSNIKVNDIFYGRPKPENKKIFDDLLQFFSTQFARYKFENKDEDVKGYLSLIHEEVSKLTKNNLTFTGPITKIFVFLEEGSILSNGTNLSIPPLSEDISKEGLKAQGKANKFDNIEGIITEDGKYYPARSNHDNLVSIMIACNIETKGGLRLSEGYKEDLVLSSLESFKVLDPELAKQQSIYLSREQVDSFLDFYENIRQIKTLRRQTLETILLNSENLGWVMTTSPRNDIRYYSDKVTKENFKLLHEEILKKYPQTYSRSDLSLNFANVILDNNAYQRDLLAREETSI